MASTVDFIEFVCEQVRGNYDVRFKKMFGEYMIYVNEKPILLVCNNTVYIKILDEIKDLKDDFETAIPYNGAKERFILDIEDSELVQKAIDILVEKTPLPKPKKKKKADI